MKKIKYQMTLFIGVVMTLPFMQLITQIGKESLRWDAVAQQHFMKAFTLNEFFICVGILAFFLLMVLLYENLDDKVMVK